ncbi:unnamed protein product, partial [Vitis vinifera]|uniref:Uncharacterized protein n=1 Tax=Vitis vinifera TaxID=29760 RepID=D7TE28_VITVI
MRVTSTKSLCMPISTSTYLKYLQCCGTPISFLEGIIPPHA